MLDASRPVREGEALAIASLEPFLRERFPEADGPLAVEQFPSGYSNLTYLLRLGDLELVLRRPPFGNREKTAHDMYREYRVLQALSPLYPPAPRPYLHSDDLAILGAPFYLMERRRGVILRKKLPDGLDLDPKTVRGLCEAFLDNLIALHALDYQSAGLADLGKPEGYVARQVAGWTKRYRNAKTDEIAGIDRLADRLAAIAPAGADATLIHNDYKYDNLMLDPGDLTRIVALFDWEMATLGDPLMDLGTALAYWVEAGDEPVLHFFALGPTAAEGSLTRQELADRYAERTGRDISQLLFYYCFGMFKIAVVVQQIYFRYAKGHTSDPRFANLNQVVGMFADLALDRLETGKF